MLFRGEMTMLVQKVESSGYTQIGTWEYRKAEQTIQRFRGRSLASLSPIDKDALIASLSILIVASGGGTRPSSSTISLISEIGLPYTNIEAW